MKTLNLSPLSAKIYSYLLFDFSQEGLTFEQLIEVFGASKSSISTNLNLLLNQNLIVDMNRVDQRKRYFVCNQDFFKIRFEEIADRLTEELEIINQIEVLKKQTIEKAEPKSTVYKSLLEKNIKNIRESLTQL